MPVVYSNHRRFDTAFGALDTECSNLNTQPDKTTSADSSTAAEVPEKGQG